MIIFKNATDITSFLIKNKEAGNSIGFVPTMGAIHPGHLSLIQSSKNDNAVTVSSIFVNPAQFNDSKDFDNYPASIEKDIDMLEKAGCSVLFLPSVSEMYPEETKKEHYDLGYLETVLEGKYRPGHFQGVCMAVHRLLNIIPADLLFLGQKDYQQCMVITRLVALKQIKTEIRICPTLREQDGLAMSSRNTRLDIVARKIALKIFENLSLIRSNIKPGALAALKQTAIQNLTAAGFKVDYIEIAGSDDLSLLNHWDGKKKLVVLAAAYLGDIRLIDNLYLQDHTDPKKIFTVL